MITGPGLYTLPAAEYHADPCATPSLSSSIAQVMLDETPRHAWQAHPRLGGRAKRASKEMDLGSVAHEIVLGKGGGFVISPYDEYRSNKAKEWRDDAIASGKIPIKEPDYEAACEIAVHVRRCLDETAGAGTVFACGAGHAETVMVWRDIGGPICRAMLDWLTDAATIWDLKTTGGGLDDRTLAGRIGDGLDLQAAFYLRGLEQLRPEIAGRAKFHWVFTETTAPFECRVIECTSHDREMGDKKAAYAIELWRRCLAENRWPGYPRRIERLDYPTWAESRWLEREMRDEDGIANAAVRMSAPVFGGRPMLTEFAG